jgi:2,3-bisphosphoglycerate-independent phosphoglycerate mutase
MGDVEKKIQALEDFDEKVVGTVLKGMAHRQDWRIAVDAGPSHFHRAEDARFGAGAVRALFAPGARNNGDLGYNEKDAAKTGIVAKQAFRLMEALIEGRQTWTET